MCFDTGVISEARSKVVYIYYHYYNIKTGKNDSFFTGSGFAVEDGNYILTCAHVVQNTNFVKINLNKELTVEGEVSDIDELKDLAIIKLPTGTIIPPFKFEDLQCCKDLDQVVAIGNPHRLMDSITTGIISNLRRGRKEIGLNNDHVEIEYVQHTASTYPGNSGGPLVNPATGNVVAVNSNRLESGINFGISATVAEEFVKSANKNPTRYTIGVSMLTATSENVSAILRHFSLPETHTKAAVVLTEVWEGYLAHGADLLIGDMVVRINDRSISSAHDVYKAVRNSNGSKLAIDIYRKSELYTAHLTPKLPRPRVKQSVVFGM